MINTPPENIINPEPEKKKKKKKRDEPEILTRGSRSDIMLQILEAKTGETFEEITINIHVNAEFSKPHISPPKLSFGPMKFGQEKEMTFQIFNQGKFPFSYTIFDWLDDEMRKELKEAAAEELAEQHDQFESEEDMIAA